MPPVQRQVQSLHRPARRDESEVFPFLLLTFGAYEVCHYLLHSGSELREDYHLCGLLSSRVAGEVFLQELCSKAKSIKEMCVS